MRAPSSPISLNGSRRSVIDGWDWRPLDSIKTRVSSIRHLCISSRCSFGQRPINSVNQAQSFGLNRFFLQLLQLQLETEIQSKFCFQANRLRQSFSPMFIMTSWRINALSDEEKCSFESHLKLQLEIHAVKRLKSELCDQWELPHISTVLLYILQNFMTIWRQLYTRLLTSIHLTASNADKKKSVQALDVKRKSYRKKCYRHPNIVCDQPVMSDHL